jgi:hypothetical protein
MNHSDSVAKVAAALVAVQSEIDNPRNNTKNAFLGNNYFPLPDLIEHVKPILSKHGLTIVQLPTSDNGRVGVTTTILHESGEWLSDSVSMDVEPRKGNTLAQVAGGTITYLRRYSLSAALNIASEDDDGNHGADPRNGKQGNNHDGEVEKAHKLTAQYITESGLDESLCKSYAAELEKAYEAADVSAIRDIYKRVKEAKQAKQPAEGEMF